MSGGKKNKNKKYLSSSISQEIKEFITRISFEFEKKDVNLDDFVEICCNGGAPINERSLRRWRKEYRDTGTVCGKRRNSGRKRKLSDEKKDLLVGGVIYRNSKKLPTSGDDVRDIAKKRFKVDLSRSYVSKTLRPRGLSAREVSSKTSGGYRVSFDDKTNLAMKFLRDTRTDVRTRTEDQVVWVDYTTDKHTKLKKASYAPKNGFVDLFTLHSLYCSLTQFFLPSPALSQLTLQRLQFIPILTSLQLSSQGWWGK